MAEHTEWSEDLADALAQPFPAPCVQTKRKGGASITFVAWHHYARRLNGLVGPDGWSMDEPTVKEIGGKLVMGVPVTILGVRKINFGDEDEGKDDYGTASTNAWAQAFKRTLALFGMGLYLYDKTTRDQATGAAGRTQPAARQQSQPANGRAQAGATPKQMGKIRALLAERQVPANEYASIEAAMGNGLTTAKASRIIDHLDGLPAMEREPGADDEAEGELPLAGAGRAAPSAQAEGR